ncbi:hypothetical protein ACLOJK_019638 [Asimina triloba]
MKTSPNHPRTAFSRWPAHHPAEVCSPLPPGRSLPPSPLASLSHLLPEFPDGGWMKLLLLILKMEKGIGLLRWIGRRWCCHFFYVGAWLEFLHAVGGPCWDLGVMGSAGAGSIVAGHVMGVMLVGVDGMMGAVDGQRDGWRWTAADLPWKTMATLSVGRRVAGSIGEELLAREDAGWRDGFPIGAAIRRWIGWGVGSLLERGGRLLDVEEDGADGGRRWWVRQLWLPNGNGEDGILGF